MSFENFLKHLRNNAGDSKQWEVCSLTIWTSENSPRSRLRKFNWNFIVATVAYMYIVSHIT